MSKDFLGAERDYFMKSSLQVYTNLSGSLQYVGKTNNEITISPVTNLVEWKDNSGGTQTLYVMDIDEQGITVNFSFMQFADPNVLEVAWNLEKDDSDPDRVFEFMGSAPLALSEGQWQFVGTTRAGLGMRLVIRKGICVPGGDLTVGTPATYVNVPVSIRAMQDTTIADTSRDLAYWIIDKKSFS